MAFFVYNDIYKESLILMKKVLKITESQYKSLLNEQILMGGIYPWMGGDQYELLKSLAKGVYSAFDCGVYKKGKSDNEDEKDINWLDYGHCIVDNVSMAVSVVPVIGTAASGIFDLINSVVYLGEARYHNLKGSYLALTGDYEGAKKQFIEGGIAYGFAGLSALGIIPGVTEFSALGKISKGVTKTFMENSDNILKDLYKLGIDKGSKKAEDIKKVDQVIEKYSKDLSEIEKKQLGELLDLLGNPEVKEGIENMGKFNDFTQNFMKSTGLKNYQLRTLIGSKDFNKILEDNGGDIYKALNTNETKKLITNIKFQAGSAILMGGVMATFNEYKKYKENQVSNVDNLSDEDKNKVIDIIDDMDAGIAELKRLMKEQGINPDGVSEDEKEKVITDTIIVHVSKQKERANKMSDSDNVVVGDINVDSLKKLNIPKIIRDDFTSWIKTKEKQSNLKKENVMINKKIIISEKQFKKLFSTNGDVLSEQTKSYYFDCIRDYYRIKSVYETRGVPSIIIENGINEQLFFLNDGQIALSRSGKYGTPKMIGIYNCKEEWVKTHELNTKQDLYEYINKFKSVTVKSKSTSNTVSSLDDVRNILDKNGIGYTDGLESKKGVKYLKLKPDILYRVMLDELYNILILSKNPKYECYTGKYKIKDDDIKITQLLNKKDGVNGVCQSDQDANTDIKTSDIVSLYNVLKVLSDRSIPLDDNQVTDNITNVNNTGISDIFTNIECEDIKMIYKTMFENQTDENICKMVVKYNETYKTNIAKEINEVSVSDSCTQISAIVDKWNELGTNYCKKHYNV